MPLTTLAASRTMMSASVMVRWSSVVYSSFSETERVAVKLFSQNDQVPKSPYGSTIKSLISMSGQLENFHYSNPPSHSSCRLGRHGKGRYRNDLLWPLSLFLECLGRLQPLLRITNSACLSCGHRVLRPRSGGLGQEAKVNHDLIVAGIK